jgi:esterase/lipase superfamily enzyme
MPASTTVVEVGAFRGLGIGKRSRALWALILLGVALDAAMVTPALGQSPELMRAYQQLEAAQAAGRTQQALAYGDQALRLATAQDESQGLLDGLLQSLGDLAVQSGDDARAAEYYARALAAKERTLGPDHPDLIPALAALAELRVRARRYSDAEALELRILSIERRAYGPYHATVRATLGRLQAIYRAAGDAAGAERTEQELQAAVAPRALPEDLSRQPAKNKDFARVRVFYGTDRQPSGDPRPALYYGNERGELQYGYLDVTIPTAHKESALETQPRWTEYIFDAGQARRRYILLDQVVPLAKERFIQELRQHVKEARSKDLFLFVHGFNNTFEDSARRAAQLMYDLDFDGTPLLYSWPSRGNAFAYTADEAAVNDSGLVLADFLQTIITQSGASRVHLLAHSMGSRALIEAVRTYLATLAPEKRNHIFGQIIFTAPDVDRSYFIHAVGPLVAAAERVTLYASDTDYALRVSTLLHDGARAGTAGATVIRLKGLDTIDMSAIPADMLGHSYFATNSGAIFDVFRLLWRGDPPPQRCGMRDPAGNETRGVWVFNASACNSLELLEAAVLLKRFGNLAQQRLASDLAALTDPRERLEVTQVMQFLGRLRQGLSPSPRGLVR